MAAIHEAITAIMGEVGAITKNKRNKEQGFQYRGIDDVLNTLNPLMAKHHIFCVPEVLEQVREERLSRRGGMLLYSVLRVKHTFYADDGSSVSSIMIGEGMDAGDKSANKAMAVAMKYAMFQVFCIPTEEMVDPDRESHEVTTKPEKKSGQTNEKPVHWKSTKLDEFCETHGIDMETIGSMTKQLRGHGDFVDKAMKDMNDKEFKNALNALAEEMKSPAWVL